MVQVHNLAVGDKENVMPSLGLIRKSAIYEFSYGSLNQKSSSWRRKDLVLHLNYMYIRAARGEASMT